MIDSHQHFWKYDPIVHDWISDEMATIRRDFLPEQLAAVLKENQVEGCVAVQAEHNTGDNDFLLDGFCTECEEGGGLYPVGQRRGNSRF